MSERINNKIELVDRKMLYLSGVLQVTNFDVKQINLKTNLGEMVVCGDDLHVSHLLLEQQRVAVEGHIDSISFENTQQKEDQKARRKNLLKKITG